MKAPLASGCWVGGVVSMVSGVGSSLCLPVTLVVQHLTPGSASASFAPSPGGAGKRREREREIYIFSPGCLNSIVVFIVCIITLLLIWGVLLLCC